MNITINQNDLLQHITYVNNITPAKSTIGMFKGIRLISNKNLLTVMGVGKEGNSYLSSSIECTSSDKDDIAIQSSNLIAKIIKSFDNSKEIKLQTIDGGFLQVSSTEEEDNSVFKLKYASSSEFPEFPEIKDNPKILFKINFGLLKNIFKKTIHCIASDSMAATSSINGLFIEAKKDALTFFSTNGSSFSLYKEDDENFSDNQIETQVIIHNTIIKNILKINENENNIAEVSLSTNPNIIFFKIGNTTLISNLLDGNFPDYNVMIKKINNKTDATKFSIETTKFSDALKKILNINIKTTDIESSSFLSRIVMLSINDKEISISMEDNEVGMASSAIEHSDSMIYKNLTIQYNPDILLEGINSSLTFKSDVTIIEDSYGGKDEGLLRYLLIVQESENNKYIFGMANAGINKKAVKETVEEYEEEEEPEE